MKAKEAKSFINYSVYAWGYSLMMSIITFAIDASNLLPDEMKPNIGVTSCWFERINCFIKSMRQLIN